MIIIFKGLNMKKYIYNKYIDIYSSFIFGGKVI